MYYDLILCSLQFHGDDYGMLERCALVSRDFNRAASSLLYRRVVLSPPLRLHQLDLRKASPIDSLTNLLSAVLPRYAPLVLGLEISGFLSERGPPRNTLNSVISDAVEKFTNLNSIKFIPNRYHPDFFVDSLKMLPGLASLQELCVNASCTDDEAKVQTLTQLRGLRKLALHSPGRLILQTLPAWLERLQTTLDELHLLDNCGSITPGVLKSFLPHLSERLKAFSMGLSYSISDDDISAFVDGLPELQQLQLTYYYQIKAPVRKPRLPKLWSFTVMRSRYLLDDTDHARHISAWIRRIISASPLEVLNIVTEGNDDDGVIRRCCSAYDGLVDHLIAKHSSKLRRLEMKHCLVTTDTFRKLLTSCQLLENFYLAVDRVLLAHTFSQLLPSLVNLRSASFGIHNPKRRWRFEKDDVLEVMERSHALRLLSVNGTCWESLRGFSQDGVLSVAVALYHPPVPPWQRTT
ncbi:hypothetical protein FA15DRAFT_664410 [Coprinopsis marcescibilis]|uniref:F-box domain-containing protein n=1 Tax=Coprinopsis marcescibilis TaxID=230819 RepID=A0A5C3L8S0_COPMA|nr:hypothetical protein FA15DRAFT_664410 [Coprinopsis marcescibilis]